MEALKTPAMWGGAFTIVFGTGMLAGGEIAGDADLIAGARIITGAGGSFLGFAAAVGLLGYFTDDSR